jgi:hypothetical protein
VRREDELIADIVGHGRLVLDLIRGLDEAAFVQSFGDGVNPFGAAISYALVTIGEACRQLSAVTMMRAGRRRRRSLRRTPRSGDLARDRRAYGARAGVRSAIVMRLLGLAERPGLVRSARDHGL